MDRLTYQDADGSWGLHGVSLLGEVRKQERRANDRIYTPKTKVLEE